MQQAVKASLYHCSSTDKSPNHQLCPKGNSSWCFYNKALALRQKPRSHQSMIVRLNEKVFKTILPLYERLSEPDLLERCLRGGTQNANESLHAHIWRKCPKEVFVSRKRIYVAVVNAVMEKNCGILKSQTMKASIRKESLTDVGKEIYESMDRTRLKRKCNQNQYRHAKRQKRCTEGRQKQQTKCKDYGSGEH